MGVPKPFCRTFRAHIDIGGGHHRYILHPDFAQSPEQYIRAFDVLQKDLIELLDYIEPADKNNPTYSYRVHALLMRVCIEIEANFKAIFVENALSTKTQLTMADYKKLDPTHHLSSYEVKLPIWQGTTNVRKPFANWKLNKALPWYKAYNASKHNRQHAFENANFEHLIDSMCGLVAILAAQFCTEDFSQGGSYLVMETRVGDGFETAIGNYFRVKFPNDWLPADIYDFNWQVLEGQPNPIEKLTI